MKEKRPVVTRIRIARIFTFFFVCCFCSLNSFGANISVWPHEIKFNFDGSSNSNDAITIRNASGGTATVPEWAYNNGNSVAEKFAYIMGQSNRSIQVRFNSNCTDMHLVINLTVTSGTGIGSVCNYFVANYTTLDWITLQLSGSIPASVGTRNFTWQWSVYAISNDAAYCSATSTNTTSHSYYTLLAAPQAPMAEPWSSVLDYACSWASGQASYNGAISALTISLYSSGVTYNGSQHYTYPSYEEFHLTDLLNDIDDNISDVSMDCRDFANFSQVLLNAIGGNMQYYSFHNQYICGYYYGTPIYCFDYNYLLPAGPNSSPTTGTWNFHQVGFWANGIVDASTMIDNDSNPTASPYSWKLSIGDMSESQYFDKLSEDVLSEIEKNTCVIY